KYYQKYDNGWIMLKNIFCFLILTLPFYSSDCHSSFASEPEEVSIYTPHRFGFDSRTVTIPLEGVEDGPEDNHFYLAAYKDFAPVLKGAMVFDESTEYYYSESGRPLALALQPIVKWR